MNVCYLVVLLEMSHICYSLFRFFAIVLHFQSGFLIITSCLNGHVHFETTLHSHFLQLELCVTLFFEIHLYFGM